MINFMHIVTDKFRICSFFFTVLLLGSYNFLGQSGSYKYPGHPVFQDRPEGFYQSNGYNAYQAYSVAIIGRAGTIKFQSFFFGEIELLLVRCIVCLAHALEVFLLWAAHNYKMLFNFLLLKIPADEKLQA